MEKEKRIEKIKNMFANANDVLIRTTDDLGFTIIFQETMADINIFAKDYIPIIRDNPKTKVTNLFPGVAEIINDDEINIDKLSIFVFVGDILFIDKQDNLFRFRLNKVPSRAIEESICDSTNVMGSRDGFTENYKENVALLRTRVKEYNLSMDEFELGKRSKTKVTLFSISGICNDQIRKNIIHNLKKCDMDSILTINDISKYIIKESFVPLQSYTGASSIASGALLDGRFIIMVDRIPVVIIVPSGIMNLSKPRGELELSIYYSFFVRLIIIFSMFLSIFFLGIFASLLTYQADSLSLTLLSTLKITQKGVIVPAVLEIFITLFLFEIYNLIGYRASSYTVQTIIVVVGGILVGQNTISSGLVGVVAITVTTIAYLSSFVISSDIKVLNMITILRLFILISSFFYGLFGVTIACIFVLVYLFRQKSFGISFLHPFAPFSPIDIKLFFLPKSDLRVKLRPKSLNDKDERMRRI